MDMAMSDSDSLARNRGWLATFYRYHKGKKLGPYHVRRWKENGRLYKQYIKPADLERVRAQCQAHRDERHRQLQMNKEARTFMGNWNYFFRIANRLQKRDIADEHKTHVLKLSNGDFFAPNRPPLRRKFAFMVPRATNRKFRFTKRQLKEADYHFWIGFNTAAPPLTPEEKFEAQARDLKTHIFATVKPRKRRLALLSTL